MYSLFLCLKYLLKRAMAYFAMLVVMLAVAMLVITVSVMSGFVDQIADAAKGLFGDIVIEADQSGIGYYDEFIASIEGTGEGQTKVPGVQAASPFILTMGVLQVDGVRELVKIAGVRLPQATEVTSFADGLHFQQGVDRPTFNPPLELLIDRLGAELEDMRKLAGQTAPPAPGQEGTLAQQRLRTAIWRQTQALDRLRRAQPLADEIERLSRELDGLYAATKGIETERTIELSERLDDLQKRAAYMSSDFHLILGIGIRSMIARTEDGQTIRMVAPGDQVTLLVAPLGEQMTVGDVSPNRGRFTVIDDSRSDVQPIDTEFVYVPFETLQKLNNMGPRYELAAPQSDPNDPSQYVQVLPARASQIHVKVDPAVASDEERLLEVAGAIEQRWAQFHRDHPDAVSSAGVLSVQTWRQRQAGVIEPIEKQRTLVALMFGVMYIVVVVIIIVIFYTIVMHKTRDIGVLKAVGASSLGVTRIFLLYGAAVGVVGSAAGVLLGWSFVTNINEIQDFTARHFGFRVWTRDVFMFERIPSTVDWSSMLWIVMAAVASALAGALIPALIAARMQPVRALRYE